MYIYIYVHSRMCDPTVTHGNSEGFAASHLGFRTWPGHDLRPEVPVVPGASGFSGRRTTTRPPYRSVSIYKCIYVQMYMYTKHVLYMYTLFTYIYIHTNMNIGVYMYVHIHIYMHIYICIDARISIYVFAYGHTYMYMHTCVCVCVYTCVYSFNVFLGGCKSCSGGIDAARRVGNSFFSSESYGGSS